MVVHWKSLQNWLPGHKWLCHLPGWHNFCVLTTAVRNMTYLILLSSCINNKRTITLGTPGNVDATSVILPPLSSGVYDLCEFLVVLPNIQEGYLAITISTNYYCEPLATIPIALIQRHCSTHAIVRKDTDQPQHPLTSTNVSTQQKFELPFGLKNLPGSFNCTCNAGWTGDGQICYNPCNGSCVSIPKEVSCA